MNNRFYLFLLCCLLPAGNLIAGGVYQEPDAFIQESFPGAKPEAKIFWPSAELKQKIERVLGHAYQSLRIRYWQTGQRTAWILEEIGKDKPITTGVLINQHKIEKIRVLVFRESRGWEVRHGFFTEQFDNATLDKDLQLDRHIDNISGATLSVNALEKIARLALLLEQQVTADDQP